MRRIDIGGVVIRIWRQEALRYGMETRIMDSDVLKVIKQHHHRSFLILGRAILELDRVNAVEILDKTGNGDVLYKDWP